MTLKKGTLFDKRYLLVTDLGKGASAQVWLANDTMAAGMKVAIKVLSSHHGIDTVGIQNFQREFTYVYNIQHQNLLTPSNYAICEGTPYLVLPYCENGSATSMLGRSDENDIIRFLHDVAAALECLHANKIIHQDIKPDNVLLDDNCNFLVTDFGISIQSSDVTKNKAGRYGGTQPYMGPERFEKDAVPVKMNDIWAMGATAYEMITGNPPFGDNGGMVQAMGEPVPDLPDTLQPELRQLIFSCLDPEPWNRPSAEYVRKITQRYIETGSWKEKTGKIYLYGAIAAAAVVLLLCGLLVWDYNRTKVFYYKDYVEYWGIPEGIGALSGSEMRHRQMTYRMEYSQRKLRRLSLVNPEGNLTKHRDSENILSRYVDVRYFYTDDGKIDYKTVYDQVGKLLFKMDYDEALKTVTFRQNDEYGTEMNLRASTTDRLGQGQDLIERKSRISRYLLSYDNKGLLTKLRYVGLQNVPAGDEENIYGIRYEYDEKGRKIEEQFLGADGEPTSNGIGLSITQYDYNEEDDWCAIRYLNIERGPAHDGNNCPLVKIENDEWGNRIQETYHTITGEPSIRTDHGIAGFSYAIDDDGHCTSMTCLGLDGKPMPCRYGFTTLKYQYDENGYECQNAYYDADGNVSNFTENGETYSSVALKNNRKGLIEEAVFYDENGEESEQYHGYSKIKYAYDSIGNQTEVKYFNSQHVPVLYDGLYAKICVAYDEFSHVISIKKYDINGKPATDENGIYATEAEYNRQGAVVRMSFFGKDGKPSIGGNFDASRTWDYDEIGNEKTLQFFDTEGKPTNNGDGIARYEYAYDSKSNFRIATKGYDAKGALVSTLCQEYDQRGNVLKEYLVTSAGQLKKGTAVLHSEYDKNNRAVTVWYSDLNGKPVNKPGAKYAKFKNVYDERGNATERTFWDTNGHPAVDEQGAFKRVQRFNDLGLPVYERNLTADGKPLTGRDVNPEGKVEYDKQGNAILIECYDGYGKPRLSSDGFFRATSKYNSHNKLTEHSFYDTNGKLVKSRSNDYARKVSVYDSHGMETETTYFDEHNKAFRQDTYKYNEKNRLTEHLILNEKKQQEDKFWGFSKMVIAYNSNGLVPSQRTYYNRSGTKLAYQNYNSQKKTWDNIVGLNSQTAFNITGNHWKKAVMEAAALCPIDAGNGVQIRTIAVEGNSVTCTVRILALDAADLDEEKLLSIKSMLPTLTAQMKKVFGVPGSVHFALIVQDKNGKRL